MLDARVIRDQPLKIEAEAIRGTTVEHRDTGLCT